MSLEAPSTLERGTPTLQPSRRRSPGALLSASGPLRITAHAEGEIPTWMCSSSGRRISLEKPALDCGSSWSYSETSTRTTEVPANTRSPLPTTTESVTRTGERMPGRITWVNP